MNDDIRRYGLLESAAGGTVFLVRDTKSGMQMPGNVYKRDVDYLFQCPRWDPEQRTKVHDHISAENVDELRYLIAQYFKDKP